MGPMSVDREYLTMKNQALSNRFFLKKINELIDTVYDPQRLIFEQIRENKKWPKFPFSA